MKTAARFVKNGFCLVGLAVLISITACEPIITEGTYYYKVRNETKKALKVKYKAKRNVYFTKMPVKPNSTERIALFKTDKQVKDLDENFISKFFDFLKIKTKDSTGIKKDYNKRDNWVLEHNQIEEGPFTDEAEVYYIFELKSQDL